MTKKKMKCCMCLENTEYGMTNGISKKVICWKCVGGLAAAVVHKILWPQMDTAIQKLPKKGE
jgi:hypothetical protein